MNETTNPKDTVLIVDDNPNNLKLLFDLLNDAGFRVLAASSGQLCFKILDRANPDLILLDVMMPGIDGFEVCQKLKSQEGTRDIPIIFMTALSDTDSTVKAFQIGAADYITKPFIGDIVLARVNAHISLRRLQKQQLFKQNQLLQQEIVVRKQAEKALLEREQTLSAILNAATESIILIEPEGTCVTINSTGAARLGATVDEIEGQSFYDFLPPEAAANRKASIDKTLLTGETTTLEDERAGMWLESTIYPILDDNNIITRIALFVRDMTERKQAEQALRESKNRLAEAQSIAHIGHWEKNIVTHEWLWSQETFRIFGLSPNKTTVTYETFINAIHPDDRENVQQALTSAIDQQKLYLPEFRIVRPNGTIRYIQAIGQLIPEATGQPIRQLGTLQDITRRKRLENALRDSERFARSTIDALSAHLCVLNETGTIIMANQAWRQFAESNSANSDKASDGANGRESTPTSFLSVAEGANYLAVCETDQGEEAKEAQTLAAGIRTVLNGERDQFSLEYCCYHSATERLWFDVKATRLYGEKPTYVVVIHENITERKLAEIALRESEQRLSAILNASTDTISMLEPDGTCVTINPAGAARLGATVDEINGHCIYEWFPHIVAKTRKAIIEKVVSLGESLYFEDNRADIWFDSYCHPVLNDNGKVIRVVVIARDITNRKQAEESLRESEQRYRNIIETANEGIWFIDSDNLTTFVNQKMADMLGYTEAEMLGRSLFDFMDEQWQQQAVQNVERRHQGIAEQHDFKFQCQDGTSLWVILNTGPRFDNAGQYIGAFAMVTDITDRQRMEQELRRQQKFLRLVIDSVPPFIFWKDINKRYLGCNHKFAQAAGVNTPDEIVGKTDVELAWTAEEIKLFQAFDRHLMDRDIPEYYMIETIQSDDNQPIWVETNKIPLHDANGTIMGILGTFEDITERKRAEEKLRESQARLAETQRIAHLGHWKWDMNTGQLEWSEEVFRHFGLSYVSSKKVSLATFINAIHPDDRGYVAQKIEQAFYKKQPYQAEFRIVWPDGTVRHLQSFGKVVSEADKSETLAKLNGLHPPNPSQYLPAFSSGKLASCSVHSEQSPETSASFFDNNGRITSEPSYMLCTSQDITERKQAEMSLQQSKVALEQANAELNRFKTTLDMTIDGMLMMEAGTFKFIYANQGATQLLGYSQEEFQQMTLPQIEKPDENDQSHFLPKCHSPPTTLESVYRHKNGTLISVEVSLQCVSIEGQKNRFVAIVRNITERQQAQAQLQQAFQAAEMANYTKSAFIANISHELRTPLNAILGYAQIFQRDNTLSTELREGIDIIQRNGEYLLTLISDILDISKVEAGRLELYLTDFSLKHFLNGIIELFRIRAEQKQIDFEYQQLSELPSVIQADEKRLRQILINLLSNAIKFTQQGRVILKMGVIERDISIRPHQENQFSKVKMVFEVKDSGIGIAPDNLDKIFLPFEQVGCNNDKSAGTGLGLSITKKLVEIMGGQIHVESVLGQGCTFWVELDFPTCSEEILPMMAEKPMIIGFEGPPRKILVVDDDRVSRLVSIHLLKPLGFELKEASNGEDAIETVRQWPPDLILMDMVMPEVDGFEATSQIKQMSKNVAIIAVSASVFESERQKSLDVGCNGFITKPVHAEKLLECLRVHLNLTWRYRENDIATTDEPAASNAVKGLNAEQADHLIHFTRRGDIDGIIEYMEQLEQMDDQLVPFAQKIKQLAAQLAIKQIHQIAQNGLEEQ